MATPQLALLSVPGAVGDGTKSHQEDNWVQCDRCAKWRRVSQNVVDELDDDANWFCEDNDDELHNNCGIPQELTNEEIDRGRQLEILKQERLRRQRRPAVWQLIRENIFAHRKRKKLFEEDIMVCQCKAASQNNGNSCKHKDCLNGMLNIECISGFCPCAKECQNQRFQRKQYSKFEVKRAGLKGFGLFAKEAIPKGAFIVEYVGEVLDEEEYVRRKQYYHSVGQRHYYFMNIGNGEVIDACRKGNRARFINHSCVPNCETQKWMVKGELAIGFFAIRDIARGEEIQFDYNFDRFGDKPTKCYCGAAQCRGFIGGSADKYQGLAVDDAGILGEDIKPIMITNEMKEHPDAFQRVLDQSVGKLLGEDVDDIVERRLKALAAQQGTIWVDSEDDSGDYTGITGAAKVALADAVVAAVAPETVPAVATVDVYPPVISPAAPAPAAAPAVSSASSEPEISSDEEEESLSIEDEDADEPDWLDSVDRYKENPDLGAPPPAPPLIPQTNKRARTQTPPPTSPRKARRSAPPEKPSVPKAARPSAWPIGKPSPAQASDLRSKPDLERESVPPHSAGPTNNGAALLGLPEATHLHPPAPPVRRKRSAVTPDAPEKQPQPAARERDVAGAVDGAAATAHEPSGSPQAPVIREPPAIRPSPLMNAVRARAEVLARAEREAQQSAAVDAPNAQQDAAATMSPAAEQPLSQVRPKAKKRLIRKILTTSPVKPLKSDVSDGTCVDSVDLSARPQAPVNSLKRPAFPRPGTKSAAATTGKYEAVAGRKRSEVDRRLDGLLSKSRRLKRDSVVHFVRLFNMCDISPPSKEDDSRLAHADSLPNPAEGVAKRPRRHNLETEAQLTYRQKARLADLNLLLDVVLTISSLSLQNELMRCGILSRLQFTAMFNYGSGYAVALRKICRVLELLPFTGDDIYSRRSAQGCFGDVLQHLVSNVDPEVRARASQLLTVYPPPGGGPGTALTAASGTHGGEGRRGRGPPADRDSEARRGHAHDRRDGRPVLGARRGSAAPSHAQGEVGALLPRHASANDFRQANFFPPGHGPDDAKAPLVGHRRETVSNRKGAEGIRGGASNAVSLLPFGSSASGPDGTSYTHQRPAWLSNAARVGLGRCEWRAQQMGQMDVTSHVIGQATDLIDGLNMGLYGAAPFMLRSSRPHKALPRKT